VQIAKDGSLIVSATDLIGYLACDHLSTLELGRAEGLWDRPPRRADPTVQLMQDRGDAHEAAHLERLRGRGLRVVEIAKDDLRTPDDLRGAAAATEAAMRDGADVVFQATFFDGRWRGHADFLIRADRPSPGLGAWSYDVADTKLSRGVKASAILQMCVYADLLEKVQGSAPETLTVVTGDGLEHPYRLSDFAAYYRHAKRRFETRVLRGSAALSTYPDPVDHCHVCVWYPTCIQRRRDDDHPSIVAGMRRVDTERFLDGNVPTMTAIATLPDERAVKDIPTRTLARFRQQARLQIHEKDTGVRIYELIPPTPGETGRGLASLPEPDPGDVFFDIEADPWALDGGLEYLLGIVVDVAGEPSYLPIWGHDREGEKAAFETLIDLVIARLAAHPAMHLYHYGGYESGAIKRLMQRHGTRQDEVDRLLRGGVLVDLLNVVRQGIRASVESYSLKQIEKFYMPRREGPVTEAGFSVVEYERWIRERDATILENIGAYNRDDCVSTQMLRDWLEERRAQAIEEFPDDDWSRPAPIDGAISPELDARQQAVADRFESLMAGLPVDRTERNDVQQGQWLLAQILDWHRRDDKPAWWLWHDLRQKSTEDLISASDGIAGLTFVRDLEVRKKSVVRRYRFEPQDHKFRVGSEVVDPNPDIGAFGEDAGEVVGLDDVEGTIDLVRGPSRLDHHPIALIPPSPMRTGPMAAVLLRVADVVIEHGMDGSGPYGAARQLLGRAQPVSGLPTGAGLRSQRETTLEAARRLVTDGGRIVLPIQGPPGTGKTWTGARMITELVRRQQRIGVAAQSHKAITNLLEAIAAAAEEERTPVRIIQKCDKPDDAARLDVVTIAANNDAAVRGIVDGSFDIIAGTAWLFARPEMEGVLDVLFVDEAGQVSLANTVAMSAAARSLVLLGDPNQLPQVSQGVHPDGAGASSLEHLLGGATTIEADRGLFLDVTRRMHPAINRYISETFYDGRITTDPSTARQAIQAQTPDLSGAGIRYHGPSHDGKSSSSPEEANLVADIVARLVGQTWTDANGERLTLAASDILIVAPYNAQVAAISGAIRSTMGADTKVLVGTVDKFQGQEGAVAIYSMASSSQEDAPRDMEFLYSRNRLNVAVSRARAVAIVVANPRLLDATCRTPDQMRLVDALCRLVEAASAESTSDMTQASESVLDRAGPAAPRIDILTLGLE
jgi:predicted RecB family nuclease